MTEATTANEVTLEVIETRIAQAAAQLLQTAVRLVRERHSDDPEIAEVIDALTVCSLRITATGPQLALELVAPVNGITRIFYGGTFEEMGALQ